MGMLFVLFEIRLPDNGSALEGPMALGTGDGIGFAHSTETSSEGEILRISGSQRVNIKTGTVTDAPRFFAAIPQGQTQRVIGKPGLNPDGSADSAVVEFHLNHIGVLDSKLLSGFAAYQNHIIPDDFGDGIRQLL